MKPIYKFIFSLFLTFLLIWYISWLIQSAGQMSPFEVAWKVTVLLGGVVAYGIIAVGMWDQD